MFLWGPPKNGVKFLLYVEKCKLKGIVQNASCGTWFCHMVIPHSVAVCENVWNQFTLLTVWKV